jgi:hypothetical protein
MRIYLFTIFFLSQFVYGQVKYLVSPNNEVIPIKPNDRVVNYISSKSRVTFQSSCDSNSNFIFGYSPYVYQPTSYFGGNHKDVFGQWFIAPADGTIDTLFWSMNEVGNIDSTISIRIFKSNIFRGQGPGFSPYPPPCLNWGYYLDTNDLDNGITPFRDKATDTNWISTAPIDTQTFDPLGDELWGNGGFQIKVNPYSVNALPLDILGHGIDLKKGDAFFVTMSVTSPNYHISDASEPTRMKAWGSDGPISTTDENYPSRLWKFYEHDSGPSNCAGVPTALVKRGWVARGPFEDDTLYTSAYNWWYSMTLASNYPQFTTFNEVLQSGRFEGEPIKFVFAKLCSLDDSDRVGYYMVYYQLNNSQSDSVRAYITQDSLIQAVIPPQPLGTLVTYRYCYFGVDFPGYISPTTGFRIIGPIQNGYSLDTTTTYDWIDADSTYIQVTGFFTRPDSIYHDPLDDGTAGPIDIGFPFYFFGEQVSYAWIGVDGAIALTSSPTDTQHLNSNGYTGGGWDIPGSQRQPTGMPKNFIAPYYRDYRLDNLIGDPPPLYSMIRYKKQSETFTIEWNFNSSTWYPNNDGIFRLILDKRDSSITFIYNSLDSSQITSPILAGMQKDSLNWFHLCRAGVPMEFKPRSDKIFKFTPSIIVDVKEKSVGLPSTLALEQNYPNPFNPVTVIRYQLPVKSWITLKIYNVLGQEVATLVDDNQEAGYKSVEWKANGVSSGLYFYKLTSGNYISIKKMMIIR